jgi:PIN domain nuclease of toxin-antitoxin system
MYLNKVIDYAIKRMRTRDLFDRISVGQAAVNQSGLLTKDEIIGKNYAYVIWYNF